MQDTYPTTCRSLFLSDLHLGSTFSQASKIKNFLSRITADEIYLVGDTFDFWTMRRTQTLWPEHRDIVSEICRRTLAGTRVVLLPGNHDEALLGVVDVPLYGIVIARQTIHTTRRGERFLVKHGDDHDVFTRTSRMTARKCSVLREMVHSTFKGQKDPSHRQSRQSLVQSLGTRLRQSLGGIDRFERSLMREVEDLGLDGVICGHSHHPADHMVNGRRYLNCGDWVVHCSAVFEDKSGHVFSPHISRSPSAVQTRQVSACPSSPHDLQSARLRGINP